MLSALITIMLSLVGYSSGVVVGAKGRAWSPAIADLVAIVVVWGVAFGIFRPNLNHWVAILFALIVGVLLGSILTSTRFTVDGEKPIMPESELPEHAREQLVVARESNMFRRAWQEWVAFSGTMGNVQGRLIMAFFYFIVVTPFALIQRTSDPLQLKQPTGWTARAPVDTTLEGASEQG